MILTILLERLLSGYTLSTQPVRRGKEERGWKKEEERRKRDEREEGKEREKEGRQRGKYQFITPNIYCVLNVSSTVLSTLCILI